MIIMAVKPVGYSTRGQLWDGYVDGRLVVRRSTQPLLDGARALLAEAIDPTTRIVMRHSDTDALRSTVGVAAGLSVSEGRLAPKFIDFRQMPKILTTGRPTIEATVLDGGS